MRLRVDIVVTKFNESCTGGFVALKREDYKKVLKEHEQRSLLKENT